MVPRHWQDKYELTGGMVPQSICKLLKALEHIKKAFPNKKERDGPKACVTGGGSSKKRMVSFTDQIPKKSRKEAKHCTPSKKHGGMQNTHNTGDWRKYEKDGTPKRAFAGKSTQQQRNPCNQNAPCKSNTSHVQLSAKIAKLEKSNKKLKHVNKKRKRDCNTGSDDSDSS
jgi:hypothetical protein